MLRVPEYWELWGRLLEAEIDKAWRRGDTDRWRSLTEARTIALRIAAMCHAEEVERLDEWRNVLVPGSTPVSRPVDDEDG